MKLRIDGLEFSYDDKMVLEGISLNMDAGELVAILGPNGSGKTTLLRCIDGILKPKKGRVFIDGEQIGKMKRRAIAKKVAYVPQSEGTPFPITVYETILMGRKPHIDWRPTTKDKQIVATIIQELGLEDFTVRKINQLSGGQRQKVYIGRALAQDTPILLLDEPTANLDLKHQLEVLELLRQQAEQGACVILAIHDINLALKYCKKIILLKEGRIYAAGGREIVSEENLADVYGVKVTISNHKEQLFVIPEITVSD
ncbi:MAG: ATP-binding cassette domain-containing protein [Candidatus Heimdallarchaeota archaeon]|nr:ATP-binding cassette domain-containing protein [Candidatus Heimdallarchaeota archaeon]